MLQVAHLLSSFQLQGRVGRESGSLPMAGLHWHPSQRQWQLVKQREALENCEQLVAWHSIEAQENYEGCVASHGEAAHNSSLLPCISPYPLSSVTAPESSCMVQALPSFPLASQVLPSAGGRAPASSRGSFRLRLACSTRSR